MHFSHEDNLSLRPLPLNGINQSMMDNNYVPAIRQAEIPYEPAYALSSLHHERQFRYNWPARGMTFAIQVPSRDPTGPVVPIPLKRIYKRQYWGYTDDHGRFIRIDRTNVIEKCPSCGAGPISWRAIRNKRANGAVSALRCNRQAKGACDHHGALRRVLRDRMMRNASGNEKTKKTMLRQPIDQAMKKMQKAMALLRMTMPCSVRDFVEQGPLPVEIREFLEDPCHQSGSVDSADSSDESVSGGDATPQDPDQVEEKEPDAKDSNDKDAAEGQNGDEAKEGHKAITEAKEGDKATTEPTKPTKPTKPSEDAALPDKPPMLALLEPTHEPGTTGGDKGNGPPLFAPLKKQSLSLARAAGEKITVGFKMEEVENMVPFHTQRDTLLHNILGRWDPQKKIFRKLKYAMVLLEEVAKCGGAPIKHKNWTIMMKKLRDSIPLKRALCGIPSTEVLNAALTAYRYIEEPIREMLQNIPATEADRPARMQIEQLLKAIVTFCSVYRKIDQAVLKTVRHVDELLTPRRLVSRPMVPTRLPMRFKRKYEHMDNMMDHTMQPERKLAYRPSLAVTKSWVPELMQMEPAAMACFPPEPAPMAPFPPEPAPMAPFPPRMCDSDIGLVRHPNMFQAQLRI